MLIMFCSYDHVLQTFFLYVFDQSVMFKICNNLNKENNEIQEAMTKPTMTNRNTTNDYLPYAIYET